MIRPVLAVLSALAMLAVLPAAASADLISTTIASADAQQRDCVARPATGAGVVQRTATATANGLVRATLSGASGDWDLAVFDRSSGRRVAGSASFGATELAEGVAVARPVAAGPGLPSQRLGDHGAAQRQVDPAAGADRREDPAAARPAADAGLARRARRDRCGPDRARATGRAGRARVRRSPTC